MPSIEGIVTENIAYTITTGLSVYDKTGSKIGEISDVNRDTGYFITEMPAFSDRDNPFSQKLLYVPFSLITSVDPRELYVSVSKDELERDHAAPPARTVTVEGALGAEIAVTTEPSGYDGFPIVVQRVLINTLRKRITTGGHVYTSDGADLGAIKQYDSRTRWMLVQRGGPSRDIDLMIPLSAVAEVDDDTHKVRLVLSQADLQRMQHLEPANVVFTEGTATKAG